MDGDNFVRGKRKVALSAESQEFHEFFWRLTFLMIPKVFYKLMSPDEAQILAYLWNLRELLETTGELDGEWFFCTERRLESELGFKRTTQDKALKSLIERKFISKRLRGIPAKRYFRINRKRIRAAVKNRFDLDEFNQAYPDKPR